MKQRSAACGRPRSVLLAVTALFLCTASPRANAQTKEPAPGAQAQEPVPAPAASCHCFTDRAYDPAQPSKSDPYLLATAQNSLLAAAFDLPKNDIVRARMSGTTGEDLWVAAYAGDRLGKNPALLLETRRNSASWKRALDTLGNGAGVFDAGFASALGAGADDGGLARAASCATLASVIGSDYAGCLALGESGATVQEGVLAHLLARLTSRTPRAILADARGGIRTWSAALAAARLEPRQMEAEIARLVAAGDP